MRAIVAAIAAAAVVACARHDRGASEPSAVTFVGWGSPEERVVFEAALAELARERPDLRVTYTQVPGVGYDYLNKLRLMIAAGLAPDVFYVPDGAFGELVKSGVLLDLEPLLQTSDLDLSAIWPTALDRYRYDGERLQVGHLYALPKDLGPMVLFYDADLFRKRGVPLPSADRPLTWDEAIATWRALTWNDGGIKRWGLTSFPYEAAVWSLGGEILSEDARSFALADETGIRAMTWCADLALVHQVAPNPARLGAQDSELFEAGLAATHIDGRWRVPRYRKLSFDWDVAPVPSPHPGLPAITRSGSVGLAISSRTRRPKEAFAVIEYLAGPRGQRILTASGFQLPNQRELARTDVFLQRGRRPAHAEVFVGSAENSRPGPLTRTTSAFWHDAFSAFAEEIWRGERSARELLPEIAPRIDQALRATEER